MAVWTDLSAEIRLCIVSYVFQGRMVAHTSFYDKQSHRLTKVLSDLTAIATVAKDFVVLPEAVVAMLQSANISLTKISDIYKLHAALDRDQRGSIRSLRLHNCLAPPEYADLGLKQLKDYFPGLRTVDLGDWSHLDYYFNPDPGYGDHREFKLTISYQSKIAMYIFLKESPWLYCPDLPQEYPIRDRFWPSLSRKEARDTFDSATELRDGCIPDRDARSLLARYWISTDELYASTLWRISLFLDSVESDVNVFFKAKLVFEFDGSVLNHLYFDTPFDSSLEVSLYNLMTLVVLRADNVLIRLDATRKTCVCGYPLANEKMR